MLSYGFLLKHIHTTHTYNRTQYVSIRNQCATATLTFKTDLLVRTILNSEIKVYNDGRYINPVIATRV